MGSKKTKFSADEEAIFDDAVIYKRGEYWQFRIWLTNERKYARFSLKTRNKSTAIEKAKLHYHELMSLQLQGKAYFSITTKDGVKRYLEQRYKDFEAGIIVKGRYSTIHTHLKHWLEFIGRDTKLKELERTDCENYYYERTKTNKKTPISQTTVLNEQSTINAMMSWLYKNKETYIDSFEFKKLKKIDRGIEDNRRATFTDEEIKDISIELDKYIAEALTNVDENNNLVKAITGYYLMISLISGLRRGEQLQLRWSDIEEFEHKANDADYNLVKITVRGETSKVRRTRTFVVKDLDYFDSLFKLIYPRFTKQNIDDNKQKKFAEALMFSVDGKTQLTERAISYHFDKIIERAKIRNLDKRDLVPYSFRHYFITKKVNSNLTPSAVAEMCGTSVAQIEKTYYHTTEAKMISNALAEYYIRDGMLIPV